jgi:hypothetical protein
MAQMLIMFDFYTRGSLMQIIHRYLVAITGHKVIIYSTMAKYLRSISYYPWTDRTGDGQERYVLDETDKAILISLSEQHFC